MATTDRPLSRKALAAWTTGDLRRLAADPTVDALARALARGLVADRTRHLPRC